MTRITLPPRDREEPGICAPDTPLQKVMFVVALLVLFFGWMLAVPNPTSF